jgi:hypothetical protein
VIGLAIHARYPFHRLNKGIMTHSVRRISDGANKEMQVLYLKSIRYEMSIPTHLN